MTPKIPRIPTINKPQNTPKLPHLSQAILALPNIQYLIARLDLIPINPQESVIKSIKISNFIDKLYQQFKRST